MRGLLPRLVQQGFRGRIFCTPATAELTKIVLADAGRLQEEDAERANRKGYTRHKPALPLFTEADAARAVTLLQPVGYDRVVPVSPEITSLASPKTASRGSSARLPAPPSSNQSRPNCASSIRKAPTRLAASP